MNWQGLKTQTLLAFIWGKQLLMNVLTLLARGWRSSVHLSNWQSPIWGQLKCTQLFGRGRITLARHAPAPCFHNRKSRCSWEIWQHNTWGDKANTEDIRCENGEAQLVFSSMNKAASYSSTFQLYQVMVVSTVAESNQCTPEGWALQPQCVICQIYLISNMHVCIESFQWLELTFIFSI